jgi:hypothetical protein
MKFSPNSTHKSSNLNNNKILFKKVTVKDELMNQNREMEENKYKYNKVLENSKSKINFYSLKIDDKTKTKLKVGSASKPVSLTVNKALLYQKENAVSKEKFKLENKMKYDMIHTKNYQKDIKSNKEVKIKILI